jgi:hypothetical protein
MSLLLRALGYLALGTVAVAIPAVFGFCLGLRVVDDRGTRWRERAVRMQRERDALRAALIAVAPQPAAPVEADRPGGVLLRQHRALRVVRSAGGDR